MFLFGLTSGEAQENVPYSGQVPVRRASERIFDPEGKAVNPVLILDVSSSMIHGTKSKKTYEILEREVCDFINGLPAGNKFGLVVFAKDQRIFQESLAVANADEKAKAIAWIKSMSPQRAMGPTATEEAKLFHLGTRADLALAAALKLKPGVIFFVSDGEPTGKTTPAILTEVQAAQNSSGQPVAIHTIAYLADSGHQFMKDLAGQNRGTFREINPSELK